MTDVLDRAAGQPTAAERPIELEELEVDDRPHAPATAFDWEWFTEAVLSLLMVATAVIVTLSQLNPDLIFKDTTPAGGDFGAHVWGPAFLRDHLLPHFRITGWAPDWYGGLPMYRFYMVVPALAVVLIDLVLPYGVALKIISVLGILTLPIAAWAFGKLAGARFPVPPLLAMVSMLFLFDGTFTIYGGNIASTMAGEFSFSIALSLGVLYLGLLAHGLRTGRHASTTAVVLALSALCHGIVALAFLTVGSVVILLAYGDFGRDHFAALMRWLATAGSLLAVVLVSVALSPLYGAVLAVLLGVGAVVYLCVSPAYDIWAMRRTALYTAVVGGVGGMLTAFWMVPFVLGHKYMTDMAYERNEKYWEMLFPQPQWIDRLLIVLALAGVIGSVIRRSRLGLALAGMMVIYMIWAPLQPQGMLWNNRLLPFLYLCRYFLVTIGVVEIVTAIGRYIGLESEAAARHRASAWGSVVVLPAPSKAMRSLGFITRTSIAAAGGLLILFLVAMQVQILPGGREIQRSVTVDGEAETRYAYDWLGLGYTIDPDDLSPDFAQSWARWNYSGYEGKDAYGEYYGIVTTLKQLGEERGCGRALWENNNDLDKYGTPMALMLLPYWTDGCIGSSEGLFFEASGTTPYHFITAAALSSDSSNPVRRLRYEDANVAKGVQEAQLLGIRYYLAFTESVVKQADRHPDLTEVATSGPWHVYEIAGEGTLVTPLQYQPAVVDGADETRDDWLTLGTSFFQDPTRYGVMPAADGPDNWERVGMVETSPTPEGTTTLPVVGLSPQPERVPLPEVNVSDIEVKDNGMSFRVDRTGVPVLVKMSYFPNWEAYGADGPYRVAPNYMVVIPTDNEVSLNFGYSKSDLGAYFLTFVGIGLAIATWRLKLFARLDRRAIAGASAGQTVIRYDDAVADSAESAAATEAASEPTSDDNQFSPPADLHRDPETGHVIPASSAEHDRSPRPVDVSEVGQDDQPDA